MVKPPGNTSVKYITGVVIPGQLGIFLWVFGKCHLDLPTRYVFFFSRTPLRTPPGVRNGVRNGITYGVRNE